MTDIKIYDTIIIGGGPGGYTAALYTVRAGFSTLVIERFSAGGQMTETALIENYPGLFEGIDGFTLGFNMQQGAEKFGADTLQAEVIEVDLNASPKVIKTDSGTFYAKTVIIATGASHKHLNIENENALVGRGLGYCATCDGMFYKGKTVAVVGGGNSAAAAALYLSRICEKVYLVHRRDALRATKVYHDPLLKAENVEFLWNSQIKEFVFEQKINGIKLENVQTKEVKSLTLDGVFICIGQAPATSLFKGQLNLDESGYIIADESTKTNIDGVFAVGDVRTKAVRQIVTAAADGAVAAHYIEEYLSR
ncbi:MAG: thioredoxin-disulfide reductase [Clostridia bacterium]|nr:thioredoxin-disulfide reductase [Clostridia bacterium]